MSFTLADDLRQCGLAALAPAMGQDARRIGKRLCETGLGEARVESFLRHRPIERFVASCERSENVFAERCHDIRDRCAPRWAHWPRSRSKTIRRIGSFTCEAQAATTTQSLRALSLVDPFLLRLELATRYAGLADDRLQSTGPNLLMVRNGNGYGTVGNFLLHDYVTAAASNFLETCCS